MASGSPPVAPSVFLRSLPAPLRAIGFIASSPRLRWVALGVVGLNTVVMAGFVWGGWAVVQWVVGWLPGGEQWWGQVLAWIVGIVVGIVVLGAILVLFTSVGRIVASPLLEVLTRRAEEELTGRVEEVRIGWWRMLVRLASQELKRVGVFVVVMGPLTLLNLVPVVGQFAYSLLGWLAGAYFLSLEFMDYPLERRGLSLGEKMKAVWSMGLGWVGFGTAAMAMGLVPVVNVMLLPAAAVGATMLFLEARQQQ